MIVIEYLKNDSLEQLLRIERAGFDVPSLERHDETDKSLLKCSQHAIFTLKKQNTSRFESK